MSRRSREQAIRRARSLDESNNPGHITDIWHELCRSYRTTSSNSHRLGDFPYWILENVPSGAIDIIMKTIYTYNAHNIQSYGPSIVNHFRVKEWQFGLFFGKLSQRTVSTLIAIAKAQGACSFNELYKELRDIRTERQSITDVPLDFKLADFTSYRQLKSR